MDSSQLYLEVSRQLDSMRRFASNSYDSARELKNERECLLSFGRIMGLGEAQRALDAAYFGATGILDGDLAEEAE